MTFPFISCPYHFLPNWLFVVRPLPCLRASAYQPVRAAVQRTDLNHLVSVLVEEILYLKLLRVRSTFFSSILFCFILQCFLSDLVFGLSTCCGDRSPGLVGIVTYSGVLFTMELYCTQKFNTQLVNTINSAPNTTGATNLFKSPNTTDYSIEVSVDNNLVTIETSPSLLLRA
jgi:hypothetical protein